MLYSPFLCFKIDFTVCFNEKLLKIMKSVTVTIII